MGRMVLLYIEGSQVIEFNSYEWLSQNAENVTHIKRRLLDQAVILFNCVAFQNGNFSERKEFAPRGNKFFPLRAVPYKGYGKSLLPH